MIVVYTWYTCSIDIVKQVYTVVCTNRSVIGIGKAFVYKAVTNVINTYKRYVYPLASV